jgi:hypothetical protein
MLIIIISKETSKLTVLTGSERNKGDNLNIVRREARNNFRKKEGISERQY